MTDKTEVNLPIPQSRSTDGLGDEEEYGSPSWIDKAAPDALRKALRQEMEECHEMARRFVRALDQRNEAREMLRRVIEHEDALGHSLFSESLEVIARTGNKPPNV